MTAQTPRSRTPKTVVSAAAEARFVSGPPRSPPTIEAAAKASTTGQSTFECVPTRAASPAPEAMIMTSSDVPEASFIGKPRASTSIGTTMNPPPTPKKPVRNPADHGEHRAEQCHQNAAVNGHRGARPHEGSEHAHEPKGQPVAPVHPPRPDGRDEGDDRGQPHHHE